jgi:hypothetical protein
MQAEMSAHRIPREYMGYFVNFFYLNASAKVGFAKVGICKSRICKCRLQKSGLQKSNLQTSHRDRHNIYKGIKKSQNNFMEKKGIMKWLYLKISATNGNKNFRRYENELRIKRLEGLQI